MTRDELHEVIEGFRLAVVGARAGVLVAGALSGLNMSSTDRALDDIAARGANLIDVATGAVKVTE